MNFPRSAKFYLHKHSDEKRLFISIYGRWARWMGWITTEEFQRYNGEVLPRPFSCNFPIIYWHPWSRSNLTSCFGLWKYRLQFIAGRAYPHDVLGMLWLWQFTLIPDCFAHSHDIYTSQLASAHECLREKPKLYNNRHPYLLSSICAGYKGNDWHINDPGACSDSKSVSTDVPCLPLVFSYSLCVLFSFLSTPQPHSLSHRSFFSIP